MENKARMYVVIGSIAGAVLTMVVCSLSGCAAGSQPHPADDTERANPAVNVEPFENAQIIGARFLNVDGTIRRQCG